MEKGGYVYIIYSDRVDRYYIGSAIIIERRLFEHNIGKVKATRNKGPWQIKFFQKYDNIKKARQIEYKLKKLKSRDVIENIIKDKIIKLN